MLPSDFAVFCWLGGLEEVELQRKYEESQIPGRAWRPSSRIWPSEEAIHMPLLAQCTRPPRALPCGGFLFEREDARILVPQVRGLSLLTWTQVQDSGGATTAVEARGGLHLDVHPALAESLRLCIDWDGWRGEADGRPYWLTGYGLGGSLAQALALERTAAWGVAPRGVHSFGAPKWTTRVSRARTRKLLDEIPWTAWVYRCDPLPHTSSGDGFAHVTPLSWLHGGGREPVLYAPDESDRVWFALLCTHDQMRGPLADHSLEVYHHTLRCGGWQGTAPDA